MKIVGLQKLTLLDYPGRVACTVFLGGCNFRCPFCHNSQLLDGSAPEVMPIEELLDFLKKRKGILDGVCITGGEPTLHAELAQLLSQIKALGYQIKLDSNGYRPEVLQNLVDRGLVDYVAMDVKNSPDAYAMTIGLPQPELEKIEQSIRFLLEGKVDYELRTTVVYPLHTQQSLAQMGSWLSSLGNGRRVRRLFLQSFVDRDTVPVAGLASPSAEEMESFVQLLEPWAEIIEIR